MERKTLAEVGYEEYQRTYGIRSTWEYATSHVKESMETIAVAIACEILHRQELAYRRARAKN